MAILLPLTACSDVDGVRIAGPAQTAAPATAPAGNPRTPSVDAVALLRADPAVGAGTKAVLQPCRSGPRTGAYPVDTAYAELTGDDRVEVMVNVFPCAAIGTNGIGSSGATGVPVHAYVGSYVYTLGGKQLLKLENAGSMLYVSGGTLLAFTVNDFSSDVVRYRWTGTEFRRV